MISYFYKVQMPFIESASKAQRHSPIYFLPGTLSHEVESKKALKVFIHGFTKRNEIQKEALAPFWVCEQMELLKNQKKRKQPLKQISIVV